MFLKALNEKHVKESQRDVSATKVLVTKPDNLSLTPETHGRRGMTPIGCSLSSHTSCGQGHTSTHKQTSLKKKKPQKLIKAR